jgi:serine/threonine-protein kinase
MGEMHDDNLERIEDMVESHGVEAAIDFVFAATGDGRRDLIPCLERACDVQFGDDEASWRSWIDKLRADGVVGFGHIPDADAPDIPADSDLMARMISQSTGLSFLGDAGEATTDLSEDRTELLPDGAAKHVASDVVGSSGEDVHGFLDKRVAGYEIIEKIGEGGMGVVYRARQISMDRIVALKILGGWLSRDRGYATRFLREARLAAKLDHPNIVRGIDAGQDGSTYFFAMEFVEGRPLGSMIRGRRVMGTDEAVGIVKQVASALDHAWQNGLVHRDVKPENVVISKSGVAKLMDLGLAKSAGVEGSHLTQTGVSVGTPLYMSPEHVRADKSIDIRADIYSLGATFYRLVAGVPPFEGSTAIITANMHITDALVPACERNPDVSAEVSAVIDKMMAKRPGDRYADPAQLIQDLERLERGEAPLHASSRGSSRNNVTRDLIGSEELEDRTIASARKRWPLAAAAVVIASVVAVVVVAVWGGNRERGSDNPRETIDGATTAAQGDGGSAGLVGSAVDPPRDLTAADLVDPRAEADRARKRIADMPAEPALAQRRVAIGDAWESAERALEARKFQDAYAAYVQCKELATALASEEADIRTCVREGELATQARDEGRDLAAYESVEWKLAEEAYDFATAKRSAGEFAEASQAFAAARRAYGAHRAAATPLAREAALSEAAEAQGAGRPADALAAYRRAERLGAEVADVISALEDQAAHQTALAAVRELMARSAWIDAARAALVARRRWPNDEGIEGVLAQIADELKRQPPREIAIGDDIAIRMAYVLPGRFSRGSATGGPDERPVREIELTRPFYISVTEVTQSQFETAMGANPSQWRGAQRPVENVSWDDAVNFCERLSRLTGKRFRLPTEAEWEYAAGTAGTPARPANDDVTDVAWFSENSGRQSHPTGQKRANAVGLFDTLGNVWEWCFDAYEPSYYATSPKADPLNESASDRRALRGGSWLTSRKSCRVSERIGYRASAKYPDVGFRVVCEDVTAKQQPEANR